MMESPGAKYRFGEVEFNPSNLQLTVAGQARMLEPKSCRLLAFLIENQGRVVPKAEIFRVVWQETAVTDNALTRAVAQIRKALDEDPKEPKYIETVPTVGYRFIAKLREDLREKPGREHPLAPPVVIPVASPRTHRAWPALAVLVVIAAGVVVWNLRAKVPQPPVVAPFAVPLTSYRGSEDAPSFSPDGTSVAFQWNGEKENNLDIYIKVLGSDSTPLRLTTDAAEDKDPAWSRDGRTIAFFRTTRPNEVALMLIPALGGPERKLAEFAVRSPLWGGFRPAWSADSKWIVVTGLVGDDAPLFRVSVETGESDQITNPRGTNWDNWPDLSPDGKTLLFTRRLPMAPGDLYTLQVDGEMKPTGQPRRVSAGGILFGGALWTPDGQEIVASSISNVYRMPAEGTENPAPILSLGPRVECLDLSRRGNRMVYSLVQGDANVWRIDLTANPPVPERLIASTFRDVYPQYSPDGKRIVFYSNRDGSQQTWLADVEGRQARQLTFMKKGSAGTPSWSPDGKTLVLDGNGTGLYQIYTMSPDGGKLSQLTQGPSANFAGRWSRDGRWLYFSSNRTGRNEVWRMPAAGGAAMQITSNGGVKAVESEDGKTLYFSKDAGTGSIWKMPVGGGPEVQLTSSLYRFNFAVAKKGIYYMAAPGDDGTAVLQFYSFASGAATTIAPMGQPEFGLDLSPDGRYLIYSQLDDAASDLMLVENFR